MEKEGDKAEAATSTAMRERETVAKAAGAENDKEEAPHRDRDEYDFLDVLDILAEEGLGEVEEIQVVPESKAKAVAAASSGETVAQAAGAGAKAEAVKKKTRREQVSQEYIEWLMRRPPLPPIPTSLYNPDDLNVRTVKLLQTVTDWRKDILDQYHANGCAYVDVRDD